MSRRSISTPDHLLGYPRETAPEANNLILYAATVLYKIAPLIELGVFRYTPDYLSKTNPPVHP